MKKVICVFLLFLASGAAVLTAQSNAFIDNYLAEEKASAGKSVYLVFAIAGIVPESASVENAVTALRDKKWNIDFKDPNAGITLGELSYIVMKAFGLGGGVMYSIFPGPWYACRELAYREYIRGDASPLRPVSGREAFSIIRLVAENKEEV